MPAPAKAHANRLSIILKLQVRKVGTEKRCMHPSKVNPPKCNERILHITNPHPSAFTKMNPQLYIPLLTTPLPQKVPKATTTHRQVYIRESSPMSHSTEKPTVLLVHGAWHTASCWDVTRAELKKLSYPTEVVQLKSSGNAVSTHLEDTAIIRNALEALIVSDAKKVILVMHSYGGIPGTNAVHGLEAAARQDKGEEGGIIHCLFVAAFLVPKGKSLLGMFPEAPPYLCPDVSHSISLILVERNLTR